MWQRFTEPARRVIYVAQEKAERFGASKVATEHILLALSCENGSVAVWILDRLSISPDRIRSEIESQVTQGNGRQDDDFHLSPHAKRAIDLAWDEARRLNNDYIGTEHLLLGLIREGEGLAGRVLAKLGVDLERTRVEVKALQTYWENRNAEHADLFASEVTKLPADQQAALTGDGLPLHRLPESMQQIVRKLARAYSHSGAFQLDPNEVVRVNVAKGEGTTHYTLTTRTVFLVNLRVKDA